MKDASYRLKSKALGPYIDLGRRSVFEYMRQAEQCCGWENRRSAKQLQMTWTKDTTMNEDKQCLQRDTTEGRCLEEGCGKNMLDYSMFLFRMVTTCCCSVTLPSWSVARKCCSRQVSSCVAQPCYLRNMRYTTRWLWFGLGGAHPRVPMRHISTKAVCIEPEKTSAHHPRMDRPILCCLCTYSTRCS